MKITAIKQQVKNENRVSIFVDGKYLFSLTLDQLLEQRLKKDQDLEKQQIKELTKLSEEGKLKSRAVEWLMNRPHSTREFKDYLFKKKAEPELINAWIDEFKSRGYLDDERFAEWFSENRRRKNKSTREIQAELRTKGIDQVTIQHIVTSETNDEDKESLKSLVNKLRNRSRYQDTDKLKQYLIRKGFSYADIKAVFDELNIS